MKQLIRSLVFILLLTITVASQAQPSASKPKRIFITLDVSGSMEGNKYVMANYAAQMISVFSSEDDKAVLYYFGEPHELSGVQDYKSIQIAFDHLDKKKQHTYNEISDLTRFLKDYSPNPDYEDWLFIIGDGDWSIQKGRYDSKTEFEATWKKLRALLMKEDLQVCYLQTGNEITDNYIFTDSLTKISRPTIDISKSDTTAQSVLDNCNNFVNRILGFSNQPIVIKQEADQCVAFESEFPLERFVIMHQSGKVGELKINSIDFSNVPIASNDIKLKGSPSTRLLVGEKGISLNGEVWEVRCQQGIPANEKVKVCFDAKVDASNLRLYPYVDVLMQMRPWGRSMDTLNELSHNVFSACDTLTQLNVVLTLTDRQDHKFPPPLMKKMDVQLFVEGNPVTIDYESADTTFRAIVPIPDDKVSYFVAVESPGYFRRSTIDDPQTVKKTLICKPDPEIVPLDTLPMHVFDAVSFKTLIDGRGFGGQIDDSLFSVIAALGDFDEHLVADLNDYPYIGNVGIEFDARQLTFTHKPNSKWCECAFPDTLRYLVTLKSNSGILHDDKVYQGFVIPVSIPIDKRGWWIRCNLYVFVGIGIFLLFIYLIALLKKKRFRKNAMMTPVYYDYYGRRIEDQGGSKLRKDGFAAWFVRWFVPGRERNTLSFDSPEVPALTLVAADSDTVVNVDKSSIDPLTMHIKGYKPNDETDKLKYVLLGDNNKIYITKSDGSDAGYLTFTTGEAIGGSAYRVFIILLILATIAAEVLVCLTMGSSIN